MINHIFPLLSKNRGIHGDEVRIVASIGDLVRVCSE